MREVQRRQFHLGQAPIGQIWIDPKSRDDIPAVLKGLQHIWGEEALRARLFALLDEHILPEADRTVGRPGMELWQILVLGVLKQGLGCDFDRLHDLANHHATIRAFLGHGDFVDKTRRVPDGGRQRVVVDAGVVVGGRTTGGGEWPQGRPKKAWRAIARAV